MDGGEGRAHALAAATRRGARDLPIVCFELRVLSALHDPVARLGGPISRRLQAAATRRYIDAMTTLEQ
jgi:hypothetical protein